MSDKYTIKGSQWPISFTAEQEKRAAALGVKLPSGEVKTMFEVDDRFTEELTDKVNELIRSELEEHLADRIGEACESRNGAGSFDALIDAHMTKVTVFHARKQGQVYRKLALEGAGLDADSILSGTPTASKSEVSSAEDF